MPTVVMPLSVMYFQTSRDAANEPFRWDSGSAFCRLTSAFHTHRQTHSKWVSHAQCLTQHVIMSCWVQSFQEINNVVNCQLKSQQPSYRYCKHGNLEQNLSIVAEFCMNCRYVCTIDRTAQNSLHTLPIINLQCQQLCISHSKFKKICHTTSTNLDCFSQFFHCWQCSIKTFKLLREIWQKLHCRFTAESSSGKITEISLRCAKLWASVEQFCLTV